MKKAPIGRFTPIRYNKKNPITVGGSTSGTVNIASQHKIHVSFFNDITKKDASIPRKKVTTIEMAAVVNEIIIGEKSMVTPF